MKRRLFMISCCIILATVLISGCGSKAEDNKNTDNTEEHTNMEEKKLLSVEDFIRMTGISEKKYSDIDLEQFIKDYEITESDIGVLNIELLLSEYESVSGIIDVSSILNATEQIRTADFTEDAEEIAFYENINTGVKSVYIDLKNRIRYKADEGFVFDDLNLADQQETVDCGQLISELDKNGVFTWVSTADTEGISDPQSMLLVVRYSDGSEFRLTASGVLSKLLPSNYSYIREILIG